MTMSVSLHLLIILGLSFISVNTSQVIDNNTLIYGWDKYHKNNLYCQFATGEQLKSRGIESSCLSRNNGMRYILADGSETFPYIAFGSPIGFILKCGDIPRGNLLPECSRNVHSLCSYTCGGSDTVHTMKCNLMGPWNNVTAQWSEPEPCPGPPVVKPLTEGGTSDNMLPVYTGVPIGGGLLIAIILCLMRYKPWNKCKGQPNTSSSDEEQGAISSNEGQDINSSDEVKNSQLQPLIENPDPQATAPNLSTEDLAIMATAPDLNTEAEDAIVTSSNLNAEAASIIETAPNLNAEIAGTIVTPPNINTPALEIAELQHFEFCCNIDNFNKSKVSDHKDLHSALGKYSPMDLDSLDDIKVERSSDTVKFTKTPNREMMVKASPLACKTSVNLLQKQKYSYRKKLKPELEVRDRHREQALIGYIEENAEELRITKSEIKMQEILKSNSEYTVSDHFLQKLAEVGTNLGSIVEYFYNHRNTEAIALILEVHNGCEFCEQFRR